MKLTRNDINALRDTLGHLNGQTQSKHDQVKQVMRSLLDKGVIDPSQVNDLSCLNGGELINVLRSAR